MSQFDPFEDLGLKYLALSSVGFPTTLIKVTNRAKTLGGFNVGSAFKVRTSGIKVGEIRGTLNPSYEVKDLNMVARLTLDTDNAGKIGLEFSDPLGVENSKLKVSLAQSVVKQEAETVAEGQWSYTRGKYGVRFGGATNVERLRGPKASATVFVQNPENVYWSATGNLLPENENKVGLAKVNGKVSHITPNTEALFNVIWNRTSEVTYSTSWYQRLSPKTNYGVEFTTAVGGQDILTTAVVVGEYELDGQTTIRAKSTNTNTGPRLGFGLSQKIAEGCTATLGVDLNARHLFDTSSAGLPHSLGFQIDII
jgi:hypothetical protein